MLLLTQGWSRYSWENIFSSPPQALHEFETGVVLEGKLNTAKKIDQLKLQDPRLKGFGWSNVKVNEDNTFRVANYFPMKGEIIRFSYLKKNGKYAKPNLYVHCRLSAFDDPIPEKDLIDNNSILVDAPIPSMKSLENFFYSDDIELDEVYVETTVEKRPTQFMGVRINSLVNKDNYTPITLDEATRFPTILDYISAFGYRVSRESPLRGVQIEKP